ncbi:hypothetical protein ACFXTN_028024 [Malus domestica]
MLGVKRGVEPKWWHRLKSPESAKKLVEKMPRRLGHGPRRPEAYLSTIQKANPIVVIQNGKVAEQASHNELILLGVQWSVLQYDKTTNWKLTSKVNQRNANKVFKHVAL